MNFLLVASQFASMAYAPAFVFPGEPALVAPNARAQRRQIAFHSSEGARVRETRDGWILAAENPQPARATFLFDADGDGLPEDGTVVEIPVALAPRGSLQHSAPGVYDGVAISILHHARIAVVPTTVGSALQIDGSWGRLRFAPLFSADVAVRTAARRERTFEATYAFASASGITLLGRPGGIAAVSIRIEDAGIRARYLALFHQTGTLRLLNVEQEVSLAPTEELELFVPLTELLQGVASVDRYGVQTAGFPLR